MGSEMCIRDRSVNVQLWASGCLYSYSLMADVYCTAYDGVGSPLNFYQGRMVGPTKFIGPAETTRTDTVQEMMSANGRWCAYPNWRNVSYYFVRRS